MSDRVIITIGGGDIRRGGTIAIDKRIIEASGKIHPRVLFIPTASSDHEGYCAHIEKYFGKKLGCTVLHLKLCKTPPPQEEISRMIDHADIIYVGGGNTLMMMKLWRRLGVDMMLMKAWQKGTILCGVSAGSICWFDSGHSDSLSFYNPKKWNYINVRGLGFLKGIHCPHFDSKTLGVPRKKSFIDMIKNIGGMGIAIEDNCAIEWRSGTYRVISGKSDAYAYRVFRHRGKVKSERIPPSEKFRQVSDLLQYQPLE